MNLKRTIIFAVLCVLTMGAWADNVYDIWPVPHKQVRQPGAAIQSDLSGVVIIPGKGIDQYTVDRAKQVLEEHGKPTPTIGKKAVPGGMTIYLGVNGSNDAADKLATKLGLDRSVFQLPKYDRHILSMREPKGGGAEIVILGENTDAVFCGLASLEQIFDTPERDLPCVDIYDYSDTQYRGVIEGYYGVPYNEEVTADLFRFMARYKMNTYMYGAKSDPYHSGYWDKPYPETITEQQKATGMMTSGMMKQLTDVAHQTKVNFIWAIHPGAAFCDAKQTDVLDRIMGKFQLMHDLGVRQFGVFVDDVGVPYDDATLTVNADRLTKLQQMIDERWNGKKANPADTVKPLHFVPQLYAYSWTSRENGAKFFKSLSGTPKKTNIYITGAAVWTVPNSKDPELVSSWLGRDVSWWWNYPCNDNDMNKIFPLDMYRNFDDEAHIDRNARLDPDLKGVNTLISNPMQQGEVSKIALFSIADYAWNRKGFDNDASWMAALKGIFGDNSQAAFRLLPNLRHYDTNSTLADLIRQYKADPTSKEAVAALRAGLQGVASDAKALAQLANGSESDKLMWKELQPYVEKVQDMCGIADALVAEKAGQTSNLMTAAQAKELAQKLGTNEKYSFSILSGMGNHISLSTRQAEPSDKTLRPFVEQLANL